MTNDEWDAISILLDKGFKWREPFGEVQAAAYRTLLDGYDAAELLGVIRMLVARGQVFGPTPGEIVALARHDPAKPTFSEALTLIKAAIRAGNRPLTGNFSTEAQMIGAREKMVLARADDMHPLVTSFIARYGVGRLKDDVSELEDGGEYSGVRRRDLERDWDTHCDAMEGRDIAAIATARTAGGLRRADPLTALGLSRPQIPAGVDQEF